ncbi:MAG: hypothetical protein V3R49_00085, partial [Gammaproteobacteria bacterium]
MLLRSTLSSLKHSALVTMISATVFLAGTALPNFEAMADAPKVAFRQALHAIHEQGGGVPLVARQIIAH